MKVLVAIKRVVDPDVRVRPLADASGMDVTNAKMVMNPFCAVALEEAIRLKEQGLATDVLAVSIGSHSVQEQLRTALALGADRALQIESDTLHEPLAIAKVLHAIVQFEQPQLVLMGQQSADGDNAQTGQMLAALCGFPQGAFVSHVEFDGTEVRVTGETDIGIQTLVLELPAVITTGLRLNQPRCPTMPNIIKAYQKPLDVISIAALGLELKPRLQVLSIEAPKSRQQVLTLNTAAELVEKLRREAKVL